ncbi:hypothetical protein [Drosophila suzukii associated hytrosavirus 1]|nr:hypothetical protein [Drosophila suzukii associated hytrosavirus 1]
MAQRSATAFFEAQNPPVNQTKKTVRLSQDVGDEKIAKMTSVVFNPKNLKMYQIAFVVIFVLYIWLTAFSNVALIIKSLFVVALITLVVIESVIILSYLE